MAKYAALGTQLLYSDTTYKAVGQVRDVTGLGTTTDTVDVTSHEDSWKVKVATLNSLDDVTFDVVYDPAGTGMGFLQTAQDAGTLVGFKIIYTDTGATDWTFDAYVTSIAPSAPVEGALTASITLSPTGAPNRSPA